MARKSDGVSEINIDSGLGYQVYFKKIRQTVVVLLAGGDKCTQAKDIPFVLPIELSCMSIHVGCSVSFNELDTLANRICELAYRLPGSYYR